MLFADEIGWAGGRARWKSWGVRHATSMPHAMRWRLEWQANCSTEVGSRNFAAENKAVFLKNIKNKSYFLKPLQENPVERRI
ncbi:MAG: hypothetical protein ACLTZY_11590 [Alistipes indistinctus]